MDRARTSSQLVSCTKRRFKLGIHSKAWCHRSLTPRSTALTAELAACCSNRREAFRRDAAPADLAGIGLLRLAQRERPSVPDWPRRLTASTCTRASITGVGALAATST